MRTGKDMALHALVNTLAKQFLIGIQYLLSKTSHCRDQLEGGGGGISGVEGSREPGFHPLDLIEGFLGKRWRELLEVVIRLAGEDEYFTALQVNEDGCSGGWGRRCEDVFLSIGRRFCQDPPGIEHTEKSLGILGRTLETGDGRGLPSVKGKGSILERVEQKLGTEIPLVRSQEFFLGSSFKGFEPVLVGEDAMSGDSA